jgi:hypothetical protein
MPKFVALDQASNIHMVNQKKKERRSVSKGENSEHYSWLGNEYLSCDAWLSMYPFLIQNILEGRCPWYLGKYVIYVVRICCIIFFNFMDVILKQFTLMHFMGQSPLFRSW